MAGYKFQAIAADGSLHKGVLEVDSARQARLQLRERGLTPMAVDALTDTAGAVSSGKRLLQRGISGAELNLLTRQLATLFDAGLTVEQALNALIEQADNETQRQILAGVRGEVLAGQSLARAMTQFPRVFPELYRTLVNAGEQSGQLSQVLLRLADYIEDRQVLRQKITLALIYPAIVTAVALAIVAGLMGYVVPQVVQVFQNTHQTLPLLTRGLILVSDFVRVSGIYWLVLLGVGAWFAHRALQNPKLRYAFDAFVLRLPLIGRLTIGVNTARLASTLAILVGSRVPLLTALQAGRGVMNNLPMRAALQAAENGVREGATLSRALAASKLFPPLMVHLISSGEASGRLDEMLERAATQQTRETENRIATLTSLFEPILILAMGVMVLVIVVAVLLPIFEMNQMVK